jgi:hypothetical protein
MWNPKQTADSAVRPVGHHKRELTPAIRRYKRLR